MNRNDVLTDPKKLVRVELKNAGFDIDKMKIPDRVYLLADDIFDEMVLLFRKLNGTPFCTLFGTVFAMSA